MESLLYRIKNCDISLKDALNISSSKCDILEMCSKDCGYRLVELDDKYILEHLSAQNFDISFCQKFECLVFECKDKILKIAILEPFNTARIKLITDKANIEFSGYEIRFYIVKSGFDKAIEILKNISTINTLSQKIRYQANNKDDIQENPNIVQLLNFLFDIAIKHHSSDIHLESFEKYALLRLRIDGILRDMFEIPLDIFRFLSSRLKLDCNLDIHELRKAQDGRFSKIFDGKEFDFRLSFMPSINGESIVLRILNKQQNALSLQDLGFCASSLDVLMPSIYASHGIIFIVGPTGSGKSTTLYSIIEQIKQKNAKEKKIITIEDPVEYQIKNVTQVLVHEKYGFDFAMALRSILRQDPDIIMVGEVRDTPTLEVALKASLTGHLVLSTLHANDTISAIDRLLDMGVERYLLGASLRCICAQRLARKLCECKIKSSPNHILPDHKDRFAKLYKAYNSPKIYIPNGCPKCNFTGFKGRILLSEAIKIDDTIDDIIKNGGGKLQISNYLSTLNSPFSSMIEDGFKKVLEGDTSIEEIYRVCQ